MEARYDAERGSLMKVRNRGGCNTVPWGTPEMSMTRFLLAAPSICAGLGRIDPLKTVV